MSNFMCPDILADKVLGDNVRVVSTKSLLEDCLPALEREATTTGGVVIDWKSDYGFPSWKR